jgi:hypothetical protein
MRYVGQGVGVLPDKPEWFLGCVHNAAMFDDQLSQQHVVFQWRMEILQELREKTIEILITNCELRF